MEHIQKMPDWLKWLFRVSNNDNAWRLTMVTRKADGEIDIETYSITMRLKSFVLMMITVVASVGTMSYTASQFFLGEKIQNLQSQLTKQEVIQQDNIILRARVVSLEAEQARLQKDITRLETLLKLRGD